MTPSLARYVDDLHGFSVARFPMDGLLGQRGSHTISDGEHAQLVGMESRVKWLQKWAIYNIDTHQQTTVVYEHNETR